MYQQGWINDHLGLASATAWTMFVIIVPRCWSTSAWPVAANARTAALTAGPHRERRAMTATVRTTVAAAAVTDQTHSGGASAARQGRRRHDARPMSPWVTYLLLIIVTLVSILPLYYTIVMASHTNAEMAATTPPLLPDGRSAATSRRRSTWLRSTRACSTR